MRALLSLLLASGAASQATGADICNAIDPYLPVGVCSCSGGSQAAVTTCQVSVPEISLTVGVRITLDVCGTPDFSVALDYGTGYQYLAKYTLPASEHTPIPDLSVSYLGQTVGFELDVEIQDDLTNLPFSFALWACIDSDCNGNIPIIGPFISGFFPLQLITVNSGIDLKTLQDQICSSEVS
jgi:hypothetical protein